MKYAYINGKLLDGSRDMQVQVGWQILPDVADRTVFEALKENPGKTVSFDVQDETGKTAYQWAFGSAGVRRICGVYGSSLFRIFPDGYGG